MQLWPLRCGVVRDYDPAAGGDGEEQQQQWEWALWGAPEEMGATFFSWGKERVEEASPVLSQTRNAEMYRQTQPDCPVQVN